eukprot:TRINITY_DN47091_c0_g1_i1.p3 TRINITY_DN47091_c0_g1~~TRINITY_DN47091_c0_g1_i1.p3  ORF type:complete len:118 (-),score=4.99 TRINITY_DN47091_c0_g1_i1:88-411(-)
MQQQLLNRGIYLNRNQSVIKNNTYYFDQQVNEKMRFQAQNNPSQNIAHNFQNYQDFNQKQNSSKNAAQFVSSDFGIDQNKLISGSRQDLVRNIIENKREKMLQNLQS